ncbi:alanine racemase [Vagococcus sp. BWB3-3]|uniref:Alanine racemase n=1 Tax=Vagococcus allomyrinae TaxID=2794353 RepID=A0A940SWT2_9ENTE|nr:alanine racemase [Vagococcus allomyrinae]MBP1043319.1 alanine racemase [Vagococcus allomyrinae]
MTIGFLRPTKAVVDCQALYHNIKSELATIKDGAEVFAVVKANGYGHGAVKVAGVAKKAGASGFCVSLLDEALELREAGFQEPILVLGVVDPKHVAILVQEKISTTAASLEWLEQTSYYWHQFECTQSVLIHVKIDTGMGRLGFVEEVDMLAAIDFIEKHPEFYLEGLFTHFAKADSKDNSYFEMQQERFRKALAIFPTTIRYIHTSNSATALWHDHWRSNMIRLGVEMYGLNPSGTELATPFEIKQVMSLISSLVQVKRLKKGERVSYGAEYQAQQDEWIGTLPIGYADGFIRHFKGFSVLVEGHQAEIVGRICMDQCMIRLPHALPVGTKVTIFGKDGDLVNTFQDGAEYVDTINYELPCILSERVPRIYINEDLSESHA